MKQKILLLGLGLSILVNLVVLYKLLSASDDNSEKSKMMFHHLQIIIRG
jgi:hypothetical protein